MNPIDRFLNGITMYRLVLYCLLGITGTAFVLAGAGVLGYPIASLAGSLAVLVATGYIAHVLLRRVFGSATSIESWIITILILFLILKPAGTTAEYAVLAVGAVLAIASKYIFAVQNRHLFNPAAIALVILGLLGSGEVFWWVGSKALLPVVLIAGLLIVRKTRRFHMVLTFAVVALVVSAIVRGDSLSAGTLVRDMILSGPLVFFAAVMLTEPSTIPATAKLRIAFAALVGAVYGVNFDIGPLYSSPELALVVGNLFAYVASSKQRLRLTLKAITKLSPGVYEFAFTSDRPLKFTPGQYLEWTLPHQHPDSRGNRRYFTVASSPTEQEIKLGVRIDAARSSSFKRALLAMQPGYAVWAAQLGGEFTLPKEQDKKIVCIAGGIGITPFRSMAKQLIDTGARRDITLFYASATHDGFSYSQILNQAAAHGIQTKYVITGNDIPAGWSGMTGFLTAEAIAANVPDAVHAVYYISGPAGMVSSYKKLLRDMNVPARNIRTDYFPGF
ncbi:MAG TPA: hypothetical protein VK978_01685 [Candidatus Saccharimonadales bacterium]|nr:hypothetical protein [Candidatus Saccharimonadales bacterium]